ncbi:MAG: bi-domain-containing oxidoreductase [Ignavibacteriales bacterium]|nr:bi-domain-containing oxidoreductase [Ignavibacteriales bacterium]
MKQVVEEMKTGRVRVVENPSPMCGANEILVRNVSSLISPGTEKLMIEMGKKSLAGKALARPDLVLIAYQKAKREGFLNVFKEALSRLDEPVPLGYSAAGVVMEVGANVQGFAVGDAVACAGSTYASHAEIIVAPPELCAKLPRSKGGKTLSFEEAAFVMLGGIAMHGVRCAELTPGENVVVIGLGLIGLLCAQISAAYGCRVIGVEVNEGKVKLAKELGCTQSYLIGRDDIDSIVSNLTGGKGADAVILAAATRDNSTIEMAERIARQRGRIVLVGVSELTLTRKAFWDKELTFTVSKASGPSRSLVPSYPALPLEYVRWTEQRNLEEFLRLVAMGSVNVSKLVSHRYSIEQAESAYAMILEGKTDFVGVLISYPNEYPTATMVQLKSPSSTKKEGGKAAGERTAVGFIGAGMFARNVLLPALKTVKGVRLRGISTKSGLSSRHTGERYGFEYATSDYTEVLADDQIGSILICTRHHLHANLIAEAIRKGKNVFVEKPMAIMPSEIDVLVDANQYLRPDQMFMVGFNRRYSTLTDRLLYHLRNRIAPLQVHYRVNASFIPPDHWTQDPAIGGGRIIGEVCHFVDYLQLLTGSVPTMTYASAISGSLGKYKPDDNVAIVLSMADGSVGTITYTALGTKNFSREKVELFWDESAAVIEDFRMMQFASGSGKERKKLSSQDMGYRKELAEFFHGTTATSRKNFADALATTNTTFAIVESLKQRRPVDIEEVKRVQ